VYLLLPFIVVFRGSLQHPCHPNRNGHHHQHANRHRRPAGDQHPVHLRRRRSRTVHPRAAQRGEGQIGEIRAGRCGHVLCWPTLRKEGARQLAERAQVLFCRGKPHRYACPTGVLHFAAQKRHLNLSVGRPFEFNKRHAGCQRQPGGGTALYCLWRGAGCFSTVRDRITSCMPVPGS